MLLDLLFQLFRNHIEELVWPGQLQLQPTQTSTTRSEKWIGMKKSLKFSWTKRGIFSDFIIKRCQKCVPWPSLAWPLDKKYNDHFLDWHAEGHNPASGLGDSQKVSSYVAATYLRSTSQAYFWLNTKMNQIWGAAPQGLMQSNIRLASHR